LTSGVFGGRRVRARRSVVFAGKGGLDLAMGLSFGRVCFHRVSAPPLKVQTSVTPEPSQPTSIFTWISTRGQLPAARVPSFQGPTLHKLRLAWGGSTSLALASFDRDACPCPSHPQDIVITATKSFLFLMCGLWKKNLSLTTALPQIGCNPLSYLAAVESEQPLAHAIERGCHGHPPQRTAV
jgi:hypothetical protein